MIRWLIHVKITTPGHHDAGEGYTYPDKVEEKDYIVYASNALRAKRVVTGFLFHVDKKTTFFVGEPLRVKTIDAKVISDELSDKEPPKVKCKWHACQSGVVLDFQLCREHLKLAGILKVK